MEHVIFGAGLIGGYLGAALMASERAVGWVVRPATQIKLNAGLRITDFAGTDIRVNDLQFVDVDKGLSTPPQYLWLTVKCTALASAIDDLRPLLGPDTVVISLQNGLGAEAQIQAALPNHQVIRGVMAANVAELAAGHLHRGTAGGIDLPNLPATQALRESFKSRALPFKLYDNLEGLLWAKLQLNLNNPINALANIPLKQQLQQRDYRVVLSAMQEELLSVTRAKGIELPKLASLPPRWLPKFMRLPNTLFVRLSKKMLAIDPKARSSMWSDLSTGRITEIDFLNGAVADEGEKLGVPCPVNRAITALIHQVERGEQAMGISATALRAAVIK